MLAAGFLVGVHLCAQYIVATGLLFIFMFFFDKRAALCRPYKPLMVNKQPHTPSHKVFGGFWMYRVLGLIYDVNPETSKQPGNQWKITD